MNDYNEKKRQFADQLRQIKSQVSIIEYAQIMGYTPMKGKVLQLERTRQCNYRPCWQHVLAQCLPR